jgi:hypothetical protein
MQQGVREDGQSLDWKLLLHVICTSRRKVGRAGVDRRPERL